MREETLGQAKAAQLENGGGREAAAERGLVEQQVEVVCNFVAFFTTHTQNKQRSKKNPQGEN